MGVEPIGDLREHYRSPAQAVVDKVAPTIGPESAKFISRSPLFIARPSPGQMFVEAADPGIAADVVEAGLADYYDNGVWEVGGS